MVSEDIFSSAMEFHQPIDRRSFLLSALSVALGQLVSGCNEQNRPTLAVQILKNSVPPTLVGKFQQSINRSAQLKFTSIAQLADSFSLLQDWQTQGSESVVSQFDKDDVELAGLVTFVFLVFRSRTAPSPPVESMEAAVG